MVQIQEQESTHKHSALSEGIIWIQQILTQWPDSTTIRLTQWHDGTKVQRHKGMMAQWHDGTMAS